jgi:hypothetical protein
MKEVPLTQGKVALVDDEDYDELMKHKWCVVKPKNCNQFYAARHARAGGQSITIYMHRSVLDAPPGKITDHMDLNGLNNQKNNLRLTDRSGNQQNQAKYKKNKLGYKGVYFQKRYKTTPYQAQICVQRKQFYLGMYATPEEAARAYDKAAQELHGEFACLNFPHEKENEAT